MNLNRRQFLQLLASVSVAVGMPLSATGKAIEEVIPDAVLDVPITQTNPLCWIELDGVKYRCKNLAVETALMPGSTEITFRAYWSTELDQAVLSHELIAKHKPLPFALGGIGVKGGFSGNAMVTQSSILCDYLNTIMVDVSMNVCGTITRH